MKALALLVGLSVMGLVGGAQADCLDSPHDRHELNVWRAEALCDTAVQGWLEDSQLPMSAIEGPHGYDHSP